MKLYLPIAVDLYNIYPLRVLNLQQNNVGRGALITLTAAGAVIVPDSESLYVYAQKPDGTVVYNTCTLKDNQIQVDFDEQMTVESGILQVELQMVDTSGNSITTPIFQVNVQKSNIDYQKIASSDEFQALIDMINSVDELKKTGLKGDKGDAATIQVGTVTASEAGSVPTITNRGTAQKAIFDFVLPRGEQGPRGQAGPADATDVSYNNGTSGAAETNAQDALDKLYGDIASLTEDLNNSIQYAHTRKHVGTGEGENFLLIDLSSPFGKDNLPYLFVFSNASLVTNTPLSITTDFIGVRNVYYASKTRALVEIIEFHPCAGRHWYNHYNATDWNGWRKVESAPI